MGMQLSLFPATAEKKKSLEEKSRLLAEETYSGVLIKYLPENCVKEVCQMLAKHKVFVKITKHRHSKLGDYHPPQKNSGHKISINHNLNKYSFLITMLHELAHLAVHEKFKRRTKPHGKEWKTEFRQILEPFIQAKNFSPELISALTEYLQNPAASSCTDVNLQKALKKFDENNRAEKIFLLEEIPENAVFCLSGTAKIFKKGKKLRKRFLCNELHSKRKYLVSPVAEVKIVEK